MSTSLVLPGDPLPLPSSSSSSNETLKLHLGPGTMEALTRDHSHTVYVAQKMGPVQMSNKRRKVREGPSEMVTRVWVDVEAKRVSVVMCLSNG